MDKYEYNVKSDQIKKLYSQKNYEAAAEIADEIDWYKVKDNAMINRVADIYENLRQYEKAKDILLIAYERSPLGRQLAYKLTILALRTNNFVEADEFYQDFVEMSPSDVTQYLLKYRIAKAKGEDIEVLIQILEAYVDVEMDERWQYELAKLYHQAGRDDKCVQMCNELELWFHDGKYVNKAKELKKLITGVMEEYNKRYAGESGAKTFINADTDDKTGKTSQDSEKDETAAVSKETDRDNADVSGINEAADIHHADRAETIENTDIEAPYSGYQDAQALTEENISRESLHNEDDTSETEDLYNDGISEDDRADNSENVISTGDNMDYLLEHAKANEQISDQIFNEEDGEIADAGESAPSFDSGETLELEEIDDGEEYDRNRDDDESGNNAEGGYGIDDSENDETDDAEDYDGEESYDAEDDGYSPMRYLAESIVDGDQREADIRRAEEVLREAEAAAVEAQRAADLAKKFVEEARTRVNIIKGISTSKAVLETGQFAGMTLDEVRAKLDEEERKYEKGEYISNAGSQEREKHRRHHTGSRIEYDNSDSKIEIFEFDKSKEGKGKKIGDELTKTAEIDIDEIKINLGDSDDIYNTANIQEALAKSMAKLLGHSSAQQDNEAAELENPVSDNEVSEKEPENEQENESENEQNEPENEQQNDRIARGSNFGDDYLDDYNNEPTKRINREEINRLLKESRNIYQTVPLSPFLNQEEDGQIGMAEPEEQEEQIEGQMTLEEVLAALEHPQDTAETDTEVDNELEEEAEIPDNKVTEATEMEATENETVDTDTEESETSDAEVAEAVAYVAEDEKKEENIIETIEEVTETFGESDIVKAVETAENGAETFGESDIAKAGETAEDNTDTDKAAESVDEVQNTPDNSIEAVDVLEEIPETIENTTKAVEKKENKEIAGAVSDKDLAEEVRAMMEGLGEGEPETKAESETDYEKVQVSIENTPDDISGSNTKPQDTIKDLTESDEKSEDTVANLSEPVTETVITSDMNAQSESKTDIAEEKETDNSEEKAAPQKENLYFEDVLEEADEEQGAENQKEEKSSDNEADKDNYSSVNHSIPENYRSLFDDFLSTESMEESIADTLDNLINKFDMDGTSKTNNVIITGSAKSGKTTLGLSIIKAANRGRNRSGRKVAKVKATVLNKRGVALAMTQIIGTDLIIEQAGNLMPNTIVDLMIAMKNYTEEMLIVIEDDKAAIDRMLMSSPELKSFFNNRLDIEEMEIEDMVRIAKDYAASQLYDVDEIGELALYAKLDDISGRNPVMSVEDIQEVIDDAIEHANRFSIGKIFGRIKKGKGERGILSEQDFL